jgi:GntR family transcriptional regulator, negative regulator for fad regulon and positive regulator of fabA
MTTKTATTPAAMAEQALIRGILDGTYAADTALPAERGLATQLGVTRPTLREVLQRMERDGWITIQHGKPTRVNDIWREGGLGVLSALVEGTGGVPAEFVPWLLEVRQALGPAYTRAAVARQAAEVAGFLEAAQALEATPEAYAAFDWALHRGLARWSGNPIYVLILNGFSGFYETMARRYFASAEARARSAEFYVELRAAARSADAEAAERIAGEVLERSLEFWNRLPERKEER